MSRENPGKLFYEMRRDAISDTKPGSPAFDVVGDGQGQSNTDEKAS